MVATLRNNVGGVKTLVQYLHEHSEVATTYDSVDITQASSSNADRTALYDVSQGEAPHNTPLPQPSRLCHWVLDSAGLNVLHFAAYFGCTQIMKILTGADLRGLDPSQQDQGGSTPDDGFYLFRDMNCVAVQAPFEEEEAAWRILMNSARRQNGLSIDCEDDESLGHSYGSNRNDKDQAVHRNNVGGWGTSLEESGDESQDEETFQDAVQEL
ncbi:hypothetical protein KC360_g5360 [Hortaea werneckii]|nr:hypothetical protein KC325_g5647 [Hortaea werneckii]KAI6992167.1 hypothetical protein KC359_g5846 [Hortaea werneckii]KAI7144413.1 hypothetical protein KC344_g5427 [Hortaea werneckii]KAI7172676.1 hypothetical protein KC360_g5360 [Hortaea werneckii]KAI7514515.1 hypothetical protein KC347_g610 [Hortaea werneckii]